MINYPDHKRNTKILIDILLTFVVGAFSFTLLIRVFSFYTLPHELKFIFFIIIFLNTGLLAFRYLRTTVQTKFGQRKNLPLLLAIPATLTIIIFLIFDYQLAPIRTAHTLTISNPANSSLVRIDQFLLPGDELLELSEAFSDQRIENNQLFLPPGETIAYKREMVGGVQFDAKAIEKPAKLIITWDDTPQSFALDNSGDVIDVNLSGSSWGDPSLPYRLAGLLSIVSDWVSLFSGNVLLSMLILFHWSNHRDNDNPSAATKKIEAFSTSILINNSLLLMTSIYAVFFNEQRTIIMLVFIVGLLFYVRDFLRLKPTWLYHFVMGLILAGIGINGYLWQSPDTFQQTIIYQPYNSFAFFSHRVGSSTYLSLGYYKYLRNAKLIITPQLAKELNLSSARLEKINKLESFSNANYDYLLAKEEVVNILKTGVWEVWPNRLGGSYFLMKNNFVSGETYYFFKYHSAYFIIPYDFILNGVGEENVLLFN